MGLLFVFNRPVKHMASVQASLPQPSWSCLKKRATKEAISSGILSVSTIRQERSDNFRLPDVVSRMLLENKSRVGEQKSRVATYYLMLTITASLHTRCLFIEYGTYFDLYVLQKDVIDNARRQLQSPEAMFPRVRKHRKPSVSALTA